MFEGIPIDWDRPDAEIPAGTFAYKYNISPSTLNNVVLFNRLLIETLPSFIDKILHVACDIYESAKDALSILKNNIMPGTIIVFDEFYNYENFDNHELKAFNEFLYEQTAVQIVDLKSNH